MESQKMAKYKHAKKIAFLLSVICIAIGVILLLLGIFIDINNTCKEVLKVFGSTIVGVFAVSIIYERFIAEEHFEDFRSLLNNQFIQMDTIQSKCVKMGIVEIFETRNAYEMAYPLTSIIEQSPDNGTIFCVGRSLFNLSNKTDDLKKGLRKGLTLKLACVDPSHVSPLMEEVFLLSKTDIESSLSELKKLLMWAKNSQAKGQLELKYHQANTLDSMFMFTSKEGNEKLVWDLTFGRDITQKKIIIFDTHTKSLGNDLKNRYMAIWQQSDTKIEFSKGEIKQNRFNWQL